MIKDAIIEIVNKKDLSLEEAYAVMNEIMDGKTTPTQNAAFLAALSTKSTKSETIDEIIGCARAMREHALDVCNPYRTLEIVGTGGDGSNTFNISTTSAFVIAASGVKVSKHGNRAASSKSGAADCLEALGVNIDQSPEKAVSLLEDPGMCFLFAQKYHSSMKYVGAIRRELGFRTVFNILGPLTNPAHPSFGVVGVYDGALVEPIARVLSAMGMQNGFTVFGTDRMDEVSLSAPTTVCRFGCGMYEVSTVTSEDFGLPCCRKDDLVGGDAAENARITRSILSGEKGPRRDVVLANSAMGLVAAGKASSFRDGAELAAKMIDDGAAMSVLDALVERSNQ